MVTQRTIMNFIASLLRLGAALGLAIAPEPAQAQGAPKPKRFPQLTLETLDPQARPLACAGLRRCLRETYGAIE